MIYEIANILSNFLKVVSVILELYQYYFIVQVKIHRRYFTGVGKEKEII